MSYTPENLSPWTKPRDYAGAHWNGWFPVISRNRDSGCLERANFDEMLARLAPFKGAEIENPAEDERDMASVQTVREDHWAVGWVEWVAVHGSNAEALKVADSLAGKLKNYPVLSEDRLAEYEEKDATEAWRNCYSPKERVAYIRRKRSQFEFRSFSEVLAVVRGKYFNGYASELVS